MWHDIILLIMLISLIGYRYVKSRSDKQLRSGAYEFTTKDCEPEARVNTTRGWVPIVPCGLIAWSLFNDTYNLIKQDKVLDINKKGIAWKSDTKVKFGSNVYPKNFQSSDLIGGGKLNESIPVSLAIFYCWISSELGWVVRLWFNVTVEWTRRPYCLDENRCITDI